MSIGTGHTGAAGRPRYTQHNTDCRGARNTHTASSSKVELGRQGATALTQRPGLIGRETADSLPCVQLCGAKSVKTPGFQQGCRYRGGQDAGETVEGGSCCGVDYGNVDPTTVGMSSRPTLATPAPKLIKLTHRVLACTTALRDNTARWGKHGQNKPTQARILWSRRG